MAYSGVKESAFYLGLGLLFTHELDAMPNHEWRVLPVLRSFADSTGELAFLTAHIPIFALTIAFAASLNQRTRRITRQVASGFLVVHAGLHYLFSSRTNYEFYSTVSGILIYGAAICGIAYFVALAMDRKAQAI